MSISPAAEAGRFFFPFLDFLSPALGSGLLGGTALPPGLQGTPSELRDDPKEHRVASFPKAVQAGAQQTPWEDAGVGLSTQSPLHPCAS